MSLYWPFNFGQISKFIAFCSFTMKGYFHIFMFSNSNEEKVINFTVQFTPKRLHTPRQHNLSRLTNAL